VRINRGPAFTCSNPTSRPCESLRAPITESDPHANLCSLFGNCRPISEARILFRPSMASVSNSYTDARKSAEYTSTRTPKSGFVAGLARATKLPDVPMYRRYVNAEKQGKTLTRPMSGYCCLSQPEAGCECALRRSVWLVSGIDCQGGGGDEWIARE